MNYITADIIKIADNISKEKGLTRNLIISAIEKSIAHAAKKKYGQQHNIRSEVNLSNGNITLKKIITVKENPEDQNTEISLIDAQKTNPDIKVGDEIEEILPTPDIDNRTYAQHTKKILSQTIKQAEKEQEYKAFKSRKGDIINGIVKRIEFKNIIIDIGRTEGIIPKHHLLKSDNFKIKDKVTAYIFDVKYDLQNPQIQLSRTDNNFLKQLITAEVPEIDEKIIEIMGVARDPGSRAKVAVFSKDSTIDPVPPCIGVRGSRIRNVSDILNGEKIDIIKWNPEIDQYLINAISPAKIDKAIIDKNHNKIELVLSEENVSLAIGKKGQNIRLASQILGWNIEITTIQEDSKKNVELFRKLSERFVEELDINNTLAELLAASGYRSIEEIASAKIEELLKIEGINEEIGNIIINRAETKYQDHINLIIKKLEKLGVEQSLLDSMDLLPEDWLKLAEYGIKSLDDLSSITIKEVKSIVSDQNYNYNEIEKIIKHYSNKED